MTMISNASNAYRHLRKTGNTEFNIDVNKFKNIKAISYKTHGPKHVKKIVETKDGKVCESIFEGEKGKIERIYIYQKPASGWGYGDTFLYSKNFKYKK